MVDIKLKYNPYTNEKTLVINGEEQSRDSVKNICGADDKPFSEEWCKDFYNNILNELNESFTVYFSGILRDYEFMEDGLKEFRKDNTDIEVKLQKETISVPENKLEELKKIFDKMQKESPFDKLKRPELTELFKKATDSEFEMAVVATMSSGKSTLINSFLGRELLPARNAATTAVIARIHDIDGSDQFKGESYDADGNLLDECNPLTKDGMEKLNGSENTEKIEIYGDIPGIQSKNIRLVLTDTPGPNSAGNSEHKKHTMDLLKAEYKPMIVYVLNAQTPETNDDKELLKEVAKEINNGDRQSRDRFLFVLNKADAFDPEKGETVESEKQGIKNYLSGSDFGIKNPRVFPTAAKFAKIIRQIEIKDDKDLTKKEEEKGLTKKEKRDFKGSVYSEDDIISEEQYHFSDYADFLSSSTKKELEDKIKEAEEKAKKEADEEAKIKAKNALALFYTGVPSVEMAITEYLEKYALPVKITKGVNAFKDKIEALKIEAEETSKLDGNKEAVSKLQNKLQQIESKLKGGKEATSIRDEIKKLTVEEEMKKELSKAGADLLSDFSSKIYHMKQNKVPIKTADSYKVEMKKGFKTIEAKFISSIEASFKNVLVKQAEGYIRKYKDYVKELVSVDDYESPAAILGDIGTMSVDESLSAYSHSEDVYGNKTITKKNENKKWYKPWTWGESDTITYQTSVKVGTEIYVDFSKYINDSLMPEIQRFEQDTRKKATENAKEEEKKFRNYFLTQFDKLDDEISRKITEQKETLKDKKEIDKLVEKNYENLAWIKQFKQELNDILAV